VIREEEPDAVFLGGDLLPGAVQVFTSDFLKNNFINDFLAKELLQIKENPAVSYPDIFLILGNDDGRFEETAIMNMAENGLWHYVHNRKIGMGSYQVYGYSYVPPTPFRLKDWERYDVSRFVDPGCIHPEDGIRTVPASDYDAPLDVHVGSIAIQRFIKKRQPLITLHGHIHESSRITGKWMDRIGRTVMFSAAHDGPELALVRFDPDNPESASRELI
jgi:Icc-related predicted phosphoesterase